MKQIFRTDFTKRDKIINLGGFSGALICFLTGCYIGTSHELTELTTEALQEFNHWMMISDCFMVVGYIVTAALCIYNGSSRYRKQ